MTYWNIFASELQSVLARYGMGLGQLDDRFAIHREKVRRLVQSLASPPTLPILNREELQQLSEEVPLTERDLLQLRAALLATAIQRMLTKRADPTSARQAAEQVLPILRDALMAYADTQGLDDIRSGDTEAQNYENLDRAFEAIYDAQDQGEQALLLSYHSISHAACLREAIQAQAAFQEASHAINQLSTTLRQSPQGQELRRTIQDQLRETTNRLELLRRQTSSKEKAN